MGQLSLKELYTNYDGCGNVNSNYWFLGIEPGGKLDPRWLEKDSKKEMRKCEEEGLYYKRIDKIFNSFTNSSLLQNGTVTVNEYSNCFITNLYLINFPKTTSNIFNSFAKEYRKYFSDFIFQNRESYEEKHSEWLEDRYKKCFEVALNKGNKVIFMIGLSYFDKFKKLLSLTEIEKYDCLQVKYGRGHSNIIFYKNLSNTIISLPHLSHFSNLNDYLLEIKNKVK